MPLQSMPSDCVEHFCMKALFYYGARGEEERRVLLINSCLLGEAKPNVILNISLKVCAKWLSGV